MMPEWLRISVEEELGIVPNGMSRDEVVSAVMSNKGFEVTRATLMLLANAN